MVTGSRRPLWVAWLTSALVFEAVVVIALVVTTPLTLGWALIAVATLVTFATYGWDKSCAQRNATRVPERALFGLTVFAGGIGALFARRVFCHKTNKQPFTVVIGIGLVVVAALVVSSLA